MRASVLGSCEGVLVEHGDGWATIRWPDGIQAQYPIEQVRTHSLTEREERLCEALCAVRLDLGVRARVLLSIPHYSVIEWVRGVLDGACPDAELFLRVDRALYAVEVERR